VDPGIALSTNHRIAVVLIDVLVRAGDLGAAQRALRAAGGEEALSPGAGWLPEETLLAMVRGATSDARLPRRVGRALLRTPQSGLFLRYSGVATPEKAYRRCNQILAREGPGAIYEAAEVTNCRARVVFHPASGTRPEPFYCALRSGMLEGIPPVYGMLPARVRETDCVNRGGASCVYDVRWEHNSRRGMMAGALVGAAAGVGLAAQSGAPWWGIPIVSVATGLLAAAAGRAFDLAQQLDVVAGARRGQLALLDQADRSIAEKIDQLARIQAAGTSDDTSASSHAPFDRGPAPGDACQALHLEPVDLAAVVRRAVDSQHLALASGPEVVLALPEQPMWVDGQPAELERIVVRLIRSAAAAAAAEVEAGGAASGSIRVSLQAAGDSLELAVEDDGPGIEEETVDEIFDPFVSQGSRTGPRARELAAAYSAVKEHGGELRLDSGEGQGNRITALLPRREAHGEPLEQGDCA